MPETNEACLGPMWSRSVSRLL